MFLKAFPDETSGTPVKFTDTSGALAPSGPDPGDPAEYITIDWTMRNRDPNGGGCPQWINYIVIGDNLADVQNAKDKGLLSDESPLASSSTSSRNLQVIYVDANGNIKKSFTVKYALIPSFDPNAAQVDKPVAAELWFCNQPFDPVKTNVRTLEAQCNSPA